MEKALLLEELDYLKRVIKNHKDSCAVTTSNTSSENAPSSGKISLFAKKMAIKKMNHGYNLDKHNSSIFINPKKLNAVHSHKKSNNAGKIYPISVFNNTKNKEKSLSKVYINPNFRKSTALSSCQSQMKTSTNPKIGLHKEANPTNIISNAKSIKLPVSFDKLGSDQPQHCEVIDVTCKSNHSKQLVSKISTINHSIFVNPDFTLPKLDSRSSHLLPQNSTDVGINKSFRDCDKNVYLKHVNHKSSLLSKNLSETCKTSVVPKEVPKINECKKRKAYVCQNKTDGPERKKETSSCESSKTFGKKIFLNPKFKTGLQNSNIFCTNNLEINNPTVTPEVHITKTPQSDVSMEKSFKNDNESLCRLKNIPSFQRGCTKGPVQKENIKKNVTQRTRTRSTSLISVSATKLVRKRKPSLHAYDSNTLNQPLFLSKTKLVRRSSPKKGVSSSTITKIKGKRTLPKIHVQCLTPDKIGKFRKQTLTSTIKSLVNIVPRSLVVTKIKSKNGKSLKLIRKNVESNKSVPECSRINKSINITQKQILKQQASSKSALCVIQNKTKKNLFSKINVPIKKKIPQSLYHNKYMYKNKDATPRKLLTRTAVINKKAKSTVTKVQSSNSVTEKAKFIKYKYSLIRKQSANSGKKSSKNITQYKTLPITSKKKWKSQKHLSHRIHRRKELSIVKIGGVFYRCSRTSLSRNKPTTKKVFQKLNKGTFLHIQGQRFQFDKNGQTLTCLDKTFARKRIDIGGVTFIRSSSGTSLTRTNYHTVRSILVHAKQKSILLLTRKLKKNNEPCPFYHRFGRCTGKERGSCVRQHNPKYVAICKKFVQGSCEDSQCLLSHVISRHNMPTCQHFLAGHCGRDNCPYPHIKISDTAPICLDFLKGFCSLGDKCLKRHLEICPSFEKGTCSRGKYCPYPHPTSKSSKKLLGKFKYLKVWEKPQLPLKDAESVSNSNLRYFEDVNLQNENKTQLNEDNEKSEEDCASEENEERSHPFKNRPKLGRLPSFIPLSLDDNCDDIKTQEEVSAS